METQVSFVEPSFPGAPEIEQLRRCSSRISANSQPTPVDAAFASCSEAGYESFCLLRRR